MSRIRFDTLTDLIAAPHFDYVFKYGADQLIASAASMLRSGTYQPDVPITLNVPKPRGFTRPGAILLPTDRFLYQAVADELVELIENAVDRERVFSNNFDALSETHMFSSSGAAYEEFQARLIYASSHVPYLLKLDIANYYERLPHQPLINMLPGIGCGTEVAALTQDLLQAFQQRQPTGLLQGLAPSDLLANFYLTSFDAQCSIEGLEQLRYSDDIYIICDSYAIGRKRLAWSADRLRRDGLHLNEFKTAVIQSQKIASIESEVRDLFLQTTNDLRATGLEIDYHGYGFLTDMATPVYDVEEAMTVSHAVDALKSLLNEDKSDRPDFVAKIDKFAFPLLRRLGSDIAVSRALDGIQSFPYLAQIYAGYLAEFARYNQVLQKEMTRLILSDDIGAFERMMLLRGLYSCESLEASDTNRILQLLVNGLHPDPVRALAAIVAAKFGSSAQRRIVMTRYEDEGSAFMRSALLFSAKWMSRGEMAACQRNWGSHTVLNGIVASVLDKNETDEVDFIIEE